MMLTALSLLVLSIAAFAIAAAVLVHLPADYLHPDRAAYLPPRRETPFWLRTILRNLLGAFLVAIGVLLSIPGVPGQGFIVVLAGLLLLDFPGKRRSLSALLGRPLLLRAINQLRRWCSQPPLENG